MNFLETVKSAPHILTEGSVIERLRRNASLKLDSHIGTAGLLSDPRGEAALREIYRGYVNIARKYDLPIILETPTWSANPDAVKMSGISSERDINREAFRFLNRLRDSYGNFKDRIFIGGLMGCRGDSYNPDEALGEGEAAGFHRFQAATLADAGVNFLMAATLPSASEASGMAKAMAGCGIPYALSFVLRREGTLLDRTPFCDVIRRIDAACIPPPFFYMVNCVHPSVLSEALSSGPCGWDSISGRVLGVQGNTSSKSPEELDNLEVLQEDGGPEQYADSLITAARRFGLRILGGCCGTDHRHIECIAARMK